MEWLIILKIVVKLVDYFSIGRFSCFVLGVLAIEFWHFVKWGLVCFVCLVASDNIHCENKLIAIAIFLSL